MANKTKLFDCENTPIPLVCKTVSQLIEAGTEISQLPPYCGLMHTRVMGPEIEYKVGSSDTKITNEGADIVLGTDRPDSVGSGFGGLGAQKANTIDLVVGRMASTRKGKGPTPSSKVDNSFVSDAARIYISQLTNVDTNFGLAAGDGGAMRQNGCSAIGMKADAIRIIGREGIKIVTGKAGGVRGAPGGEPNSRGGVTNRPAPSIELIAGNSVSSTTGISILQPIPLGENVRDSLLELNKIVGHIWNSVFLLTLTLTTELPFIATGIPPAPWSVGAVAGGTVHRVQILNSLYQTRAMGNMWELEYLFDQGQKYICSKSVKTT